MKKIPSFFIITNMKVLEKFLFPNLDWIQIEVSGLCNASCFYCPHTVFRKSWRGRNLEIEEFLMITPYINKVRLLYLQGWGEPFLNPNFFEFVKIAKSQKVMVGTTTNGTLIEEYQVEKIIESGIDIIAFSLTGIKTNDQLRKGTSVDKVFRVIDQLNERKIKLASSTPKIHIAYMLLRSNFHEIEEIPNSLSNRGIEHVVVSLLDFVADSSLKDEDLTPKNEEEFLKLKELFENISNACEEKAIKISFNLSHPEKRNRTCSERPLSSMFINSLGYVSPCVYTGIPAEGLENIYFGNIRDMSLWSIWKTPDYRNFRKSHKKQRFTKPCLDCNKLRIF